MPAVAQFRHQLFTPERKCRHDARDFVADQFELLGGDLPSMLISVVRVSICCHSPATRTMKNSSMFEPEDRYELHPLEQWSRGVLCFLSTRRWKA